MCLNVLNADRKNNLFWLLLGMFLSLAVWLVAFVLLPLVTPFLIQPVPYEVNGLIGNITKVIV